MRETGAVSKYCLLFHNAPYGGQIRKRMKMSNPYYCHSDAGRSSSKRPKQRNDCTVRAYAIAAGLDYDTAYDELKDAGRGASRRFDWRSFATNKFEWIPFQAVKGLKRTCVATAHDRTGDGAWILRTAKHVVAMVDGVVYDDTDDAEEIEWLENRCVYGAWRVR